MRFLGNLLRLHKGKNVKLKYSQLRDPAFTAAMRKLSNYPFKTQKTAYDVMRISNKLTQEEKNAQVLYIKMLKQHAKLDDKGEFISRMDGDKPVPDTFVIEDSKLADFGKAQEEFNDLEFTLDWRQINFEALEECRLTAAEMSALQDVISTPVDAKP